MDAQCKERWHRQGITQDGDHIERPKLCVTPNGYLILRGEGRHGALVLSCADGSTALTLGGPEPAGAQAHGFDLKDCASLTCDVDGTLIAAIHQRLLRWTCDGQPVETWPVTGFFGRHHKLQPLYRMNDREQRVAIAASEKYPPGPKDTGNHPYELEIDGHDELHVGFDGNLIYCESNDLAKFDRQGKVLMRASHASSLGRHGRLQSDAAGNTYLLCSRERCRQIMRFSPDGKHVDIAVDGHRTSTPISDGAHLAVLPDGTMYVFDSNSSARCFNADGTVRFISPKAHEADQEEATRREQEAR